jgi:hypothetical protein
MADLTCILSEGDLEVVVLDEAHSALAEIIGSSLYKINDKQTEIRFHTDIHFKYFLVALVEFFAEGVRSAFVGPRYMNLSILTGLEWLCQKHPRECLVAGLTTAVETLRTWVDAEVPFDFWCPNANKQISFPLKNEQLIRFGANATKHGLFRVSKLLESLNKLCEKSGYALTPQEMSAVLKDMLTEANSRLLYHSTRIVQLLGEVFFALNNLIERRFARNPTNDCRLMDIPSGVTSDVFVGLYGEVMVFKRYTIARIRDHLPHTDKCLMMRYQPKPFASFGQEFRLILL